MTIRINQLAVTLLGLLGLLTCVVGRPSQALPLSDRTLALVVGTNGGQMGTGQYDCSDASVAGGLCPAGSTCVSPNLCGSYTNAPGNTPPNPPATVLVCSNGPNNVGNYSKAAGAVVIVFSKNINCATNNGNASMLQTDGTCTLGANQTGQPNGPLTPLKGSPACNTTFDQYVAQAVGAPLP